MRYLGTITAPTANARNNKSTAAPFDLPKNIRRLACQSDAVVHVELGIGDAFATTAARGRRMAANEMIELSIGGVEWALSVRNDSGGDANVKVFALP